MTTKPIRIGQIVPSSNTTMETEIPAMLRARDPDGNAIEFVQEETIVAAPPASQRPPVSTRLYHTGAAVRDEARAHTFYKDVLGMEETWRGGAAPQRVFRTRIQAARRLPVPPFRFSAITCPRSSACPMRCSQSHSC